MILTGEFIVLKDKKICKFTKYSDIPESFEQVISFKPDYSEGPHTEEEHNHMESWIRTPSQTTSFGIGWMS